MAVPFPPLPFPGGPRYRFVRRSDEREGGTWSRAMGEQKCIETKTPFPLAGEKEQLVKYRMGDGRWLGFSFGNE